MPPSSFPRITPIKGSVMSRSEFIDHVLAPTGYICIVGLMYDKSKPAVQRFFPTLEDAEPLIQSLMHEQREVYFGCATFKDPGAKSPRSAKNIDSLKSFYIDIDCGYNKPYANKRAGLEALNAFLVETGLPVPTLVDSGGGVHAYWTLANAISYNEWRPVADGLKKKASKLKFDIDPAVTADGARILRLPATFHNKNKDAPKPVVVRQYAPDVDFERFRTLCGVFDENTKINDDNDPVLKSIFNGQVECKFSKIYKKSVIKASDGNRLINPQGCAQLAELILHQDDPRIATEPRWRSALSIAKFCVDWEDAVHKISRFHPEYSPEDTLDKLEGIPKPHTCKEFQRHKPELCLNCPNKNKFNSPIALGIVIAEAKPEDNVLEDVWHSNVKDFVEVDIPITYPKPWLRPKTGGVAIRGKLQAIVGEKKKDDEEDEEPQEALVYPNDLWVKGRVNDPNLGEMILIAHILPKDGMREFMVPLADITKKDRCQSILAAHGVAAIDRRMDLIRRYITDWTAYIQEETDAAQARLQFGWHDNNTKFILGNREIRGDGSVTYSPPSSTTEDLVEIYSKKGSLEPWKKVVNTYNNPGNEARAFALFVGFGSALYKFMNLPSVIVHLTNTASGVGKSTAQMAANSIWGHPADALLNEHDTANSRWHRTGVLNNIVVTIDEITNILAEDASDFSFNFSQNRGKNRMMAQANAERKNKTTWQTMCITSGNNSLYDLIRSFKASSEGEMYRILEIPINRDTALSKEESDFLFHELLPNNYGIAGEIFIQHVIGNLEDVIKRLKTYRKAFDIDAKFKQKERFYSGCCAAALVAGEIAKELGLHEIDTDRIRFWALEMFDAVKETVVQKTEVNEIQTLAEYINEINRSIAIVRGQLPEVDGRILPDASAYMPNAELLGRYEPDTRSLYIAAHNFREWCTDRRLPYELFRQRLTELGICYGIKGTQLGAGTRMPGARIDCLLLDAHRLGVELDNPVEEEYAIPQ